MTREQVISILDSLELRQTIWEADEDVMTVNGKPIGGTVSRRSLEIDRWWPALKEEIADAVANKKEAERP